MCPCREAREDNGKMNAHEQAAGASRKLLAALAVLAVAFVVLAAVPAVAGTEGEAETPAVGYDNGVIAAGYVADKDTAKAMIGALSGKDLTDVDDRTMFVVFKSASVSGYVLKVNDILVSGEDAEKTALSDGVHVIYFKVAEDAAAQDAVKETWDAKKEYKVEISLVSVETPSVLTVSIKGQIVTLYQNVDTTLAETVKVYGSVEMNLNGNDLTLTTPGNGMAFDVQKDSALTIIGKDGQNGKDKLLSMGFTDGTKALIGVCENASVTIENISLQTNGSALYPNGNSAAVTVEDSEIKAGVYVIGTNAAESAKNGVQRIDITIEGSTLSTTGYNATADAFATDGDAATVMINVDGVKLNINNSVINGHRQAVFVRAGAAELTNVTINYDNSWASVNKDTDAERLKTWGAGNEGTAAAIAVGNICSSASYKGAASLIMTGGSINADSGRAVATTAYSESAGTTVDVVIGKGTPTTIACGAGENKATVQVSDLRYSATSGKNPTTPLMASTGSVELSGTITGVEIVTGEVTVPAGEILTIAEGAKLIVADGAKITNKGTIDGAGALEVSGALVAEGSVSANVAVKVVEGGSVSGSKASNIANISYDDESIKTVIIAGGEIENAKYGAAQRVEVTANTTVTGTLEISGVLHISSGVVLTIAPTGKVVINGAGTSVIEGSLVLQGDDAATADLEISGHAMVQVQNGTLDVAGDLLVKDEASIEFMQGSDATVGGVLSAKKAVIDDGATLTVVGAIRNVEGASTSFEVAGTLVISSDEVSDGFNVTMKGGVLDIEKVVLGEKVEANTTIPAGKEFKIIVSDLGLVVKDAEGNITTPASVNTYIIAATATPAKADSVTGNYENEFYYGASITGVKVVSSVTENKITKDTKIFGTQNKYAEADVGKTECVYSMQVLGTVAVDGIIVYDGTEDAPAATAKLALNLAETVKASVGELALGNGIAMTVSGKVSIDGAVSLAGGETDAATIVFAAGSDIAINADVTVGAKAAITANGAVEVNAAVSLGQNAKFTSTGTMTVKAAIDATAKGSEFVSGTKLTMAADGAIAAVNEVKAGTAALTSATYDGATYSTGTASASVYNYVTADMAFAALSAGTTDAVKLYGAQTVLVSATIEAGDTVVLESEATLTIGDADNTDVVLTIAKDAKVQGTTTSKIDVKGTLYAEKKTDITNTLRTGKIDSDVYAYEVNENGKEVSSGWAKWTNVYTALAEAEAGQTVTLQRDIGDLRSVTVKEGVTLDVNGKTLTVVKKAVLTVDGTIDLTKTDSNIVLAEPEMADGKVKTVGGAIAYTGYVQYVGDAVPVTQADLVLPGAYYTLAGTSTKVLTTYANGAADALKAEDYAVVLKADKDGKIALGEISFVGEKDKAVKISVEKAAVTGTVSLGYADFDVAADSTVDAKFVSGSDSVAVKAKVGTGLCVENAVLGEATALMIHGVLADVDDKTVTSVVFDGTVYVTDVSTLDVDKVSVVGTLVATKNVDVGTLDVAGSVTLKDAAAMTVSKALTVSGSIGIENGALNAISSTDTKVMTSVTGAVDATAEGATATFDILFIGVSAEDYMSVGADASVIGNVSVTDYALASPSAVVSDALKAAPYVGTKFTVDNETYLFAYGVAANTLKIKSIQASVMDAKFEGWMNESGTVAVDQTVGTAGWDVVAAKLNRQIYTLTVLTDGGINYVTANGKLLSATENANEFSLSGLIAGTYTFEISAKAGYDVSNVQIYNSDNEKVTMTVTVGGETSEKTYRFSMIGSEAAVTPTPDPTPIIIKDEDDGMSLTDILLIVLVVLIVIMAAIVALRMMRS